MTQDAKLYHNARLLYSPGDVIQPGNWGRLVLGQGGNTKQRHFYKEYLLERIRREEFSHQPSRLHVVFAFLSEQDSEMKFTVDTVEHMYEVDLEDATCQRSVLDMMWIDKMEECYSFECAEMLARKYWSGEAHPNQPRKEVLIVGAIRINRRVAYDDAGACTTE